MSRESALQAALATVPQVQESMAPEAAETPVVAEVKTLDSDRFAAIARKEAKLVQDRELLKREKEEALKFKSEAEKVLNERKQFDELKKTDVIAAMKSMGFSEEDVLNFMSGQERKEVSPEEAARNAAQEELKKFKEEQEKLRQDDEKKRNEETISRGIESALFLNKEELKLCQHFKDKGVTELIRETVDQFVKEDQASGKSISDNYAQELLKEASFAVEDYLKSQYEEMSGLLTPKQVEAKIEEALEPELKAEVEPQRTITRPSRTLTNQVAPTVSGVAKKAETRQEKRARLENALRNGMKI